MAPRGPLPKPEEARQRTNAPVVETVVLGSAPAKVEAPKISRRQWSALHVEARAWWTELLASPQASQFTRLDWRRLRMGTLPLVSRMQVALDEGDDAAAVMLARELRMHERDFGLTPDARQRMRWVMADTSKPAEPEGVKAKPRRVRSDPRLTLVDDGNG